MKDYCSLPLARSVILLGHLTYDSRLFLKQKYGNGRKGARRNGVSCHSRLSFTSEDMKQLPIF